MSATMPQLDRPLRLAIVTRRCWPMCGPSEMGLVQMASQFQAMGHEVEIFTPRWDKDWPAHFFLQNVPVHRIVRPGQGPWGSFRYQRQLARALSENAWDGIFVYSTTDENLSKCRALADTPIVLRVDYRQTPYSQFSTLRNKKQLAALEQVTSIVADSEFTYDQLLAAGVDGKKVKVIGDAVIPTEDRRSTTQQVNARTAISNAHPVLSIEPTQPLVISGAPFDDDRGLADLIDAWEQVVEVEPKAKLWLIGDGSEGTKIWNQICSLNLVYSVIMPGYFDDLRPVFAAANLYVHPLRTGRACYVLTRAMNASLACVATETSFTRCLVEPNSSGLVVPASNPSALAEAIIHGLNDRDLRRRLGSAAREKVVASLGLSEIADQFLQLVHPTSSSSSVGHS